MFLLVAKKNNNNFIRSNQFVSTVWLHTRMHVMISGFHAVTIDIFQFFYFCVCFACILIAFMDVKWLWINRWSYCIRFGIFFLWNLCWYQGANAVQVSISKKKIICSFRVFNRNTLINLKLKKKKCSIVIMTFIIPFLLNVVNNVAERRSRNKSISFKVFFLEKKMIDVT